MRWPSAATSKVSERKRHTSARASAVRRRVSLSAKSRALPIATAAWLARRSTISRSSAVGGAVSERATLSTPISSPPALIGTP